MLKQLTRILFFIFFISCQQKDKTRNEFYEKLEEERKADLLFTVGRLYFDNNCQSCHRKGGTDNFMEQAVKNEKYDYDFFKYYLLNQDSLLKNGNKTAIEKRSDSPDNLYRHRFKLKDSESKAVFYYIKN